MHAQTINFFQCHKVDKGICPNKSIIMIESIIIRIKSIICLFNSAFGGLGYDLEARANINCTLDLVV